MVLVSAAVRCFIRLRQRIQRSKQGQDSAKHQSIEKRKNSDHLNWVVLNATTTTFWQTGRFNRNVIDYSWEDRTR